MSVGDPIRDRSLRSVPFARLKAVADALPAPVAYVDRAQSHRFANRAYEEWFGRGRQGVLGKHLRDVFGAATYEGLRHPVERALAGHAVAFEMKLAREGGTRDLSVRCVPDVEEGEVLGFTATFDDVTDRRRAEEALRDTARRNDEFLATLAHELRDPLAPIRTAVQVLALAESDRGTSATARAMIERQLKQLARLIDDLLDVARIAHGRLELRRERLDLAAILQLALETSRPLLESKQHSVHVIWPQDPLCVNGDGVRLAQVFANLLHNSAKYSDAGGNITIAAMRDADSVLVKVADSGKGIAREMLPRVFDMFTRPEKSDGANGLGIGLTLARRLIELHGGTVEAASEGPGRGSVFSVRLPLAPNDVTASPGPMPGLASEMRPPSRDTNRVLVVDDNHDAAASLALMLDLKGFEVRTASDGVQALDECERFQPDVVLLDIGMPHLDGYQTARALRARPWGQSIRLFALTGWARDEDRWRALEAGFDQHLTKPVDPSALLRLLDGASARSGD